MYIDSNDLAPLDVLLFGESTKGSELIRYATASTYSHAGIVTTENTIFEAVPGGLSHKPFDANLRYEPSIFVDGDQLAMLRHPITLLLSADRRAGLLAEAEETLDKLEGKRYSSFEAFATMGRLPWMRSIETNFPNYLRFFLHGLNEAHEWASSIKDRTDLGLKYLESPLRDEELGKRLYCSETVEFVFEELGLPLRRPSAASDGLTPGDLADQMKTLLVDIASVKPGTPRIQEYGNSEVVQNLLRDTDSAREAVAAFFEARKRMPASERIEALTQIDLLGHDFWSLKMFAADIESSADRSMRFLRNVIDLHGSVERQSAPFWPEWIEVAVAFLNREKDLIPADSIWEEMTGKTTHPGTLRLIEKLKWMSIQTMKFQSQALRVLELSN